METVTCEPNLSELTDGELLKAFVTQKNAQAFSDLVKRHAAMVVRTCRRKLTKDHDAEEAAQAVFILLWQKAGELSQHQLGGWLHATACNVCHNAIRSNNVRSHHEREASRMLPKTSEPRDSSLWFEVREVLDEEINQLPNKLRVPLILFHLEGRLLSDVAAELKVGVSTVGTWLSRAREALAVRLKRRGVTIGGATLAALLVKNATASAIPMGAVDAVVQTAALAASGTTVVSPAVASLVNAQVAGAAIAKSVWGIGTLAALVIVGAALYAVLGSSVKTRFDKDFPLLQGEWKEVADERDGGPHLVTNPVEHVSLLVNSGQGFRKRQKLPSGKEIAGESGSFLLSGSDESKGIDMRMWQGTVRGIYKLEGEQLTLCVVIPDKGHRASTRPDSFTTAKGDGRRLVRYEKVK